MIETPVAALSSTHYSTALGSLGQEGPIQQKNQVTYFQCFNYLGSGRLSASLASEN